MSDVIDKLHADHGHIARLMDLMDEQIRIVRAHDNPDSAMMQDVMAFMTHYPDLIHHPLEDLMFEHIIRIDRSAEERLRALMDEHDRLARAGHELKMNVDCLESESLVRRDVLDRLATEYVVLQRQHMRTEEEFAFPLARKLLDDEEWETIRAEFKVKDHEIFGQVLDTHYQNLYHAITGAVD